MADPAALKVKIKASYTKYKITYTHMKIHHYTVVSGDPSRVMVTQGIIHHRFKPSFASHYIKGKFLLLYFLLHIYLPTG